jgi:hypothetical protein
MPPALDFPDPPLTVGQQYAAPTGVLYAWDGAVWTAGPATTGLPPSGPAGGDLVGTYPNPTLAASQKNLWQVSGASLTPIDATKQVMIPGPPAAATDNAAIVMGARTQKGRVHAFPGADWVGLSENARWNGSGWVRDDTAQRAWMLGGGASLGLTYLDAAGVATNPLSVGTDGKTVCTLADASVTAPMLANGASVRVANAVAAPANFTVAPPYATFTEVIRTGTFTVPANANVFIFNAVALAYTGSATLNSVYLQLQRDTTVLYSAQYDVFSGGGTYKVPLPMFAHYDNNAPAGGHLYRLMVYVANNAGNVVTAASPGMLSAWVMS